MSKGSSHNCSAMRDAEREQGRSRIGLIIGYATLGAISLHSNSLTTNSAALRFLLQSKSQNGFRQLFFGVRDAAGATTVGLRPPFIAPTTPRFSS